MPQLGSENPRLDRIQPAVVAFQVVIILLRLPVITDHVALARQFFVVGGNGTSLATGAEVLAGIEAERGSPANRTRLHPTVVSR